MTSLFLVFCLLLVIKYLRKDGAIMSVLLSPREYKVLRTTRRHFYLYEEYGKSDKDICDRLCKLGYMTRTEGFVFITESGKAVLNARFQSNVKTWVPIFVSIVSLIISIIALLKQ